MRRCQDERADESGKEAEHDSEAVRVRNAEGEKRDVEFIPRIRPRR
jgi:hypothetical protein